MSSLGPSTLRFPSQEAIASCLEKHPVVGKQRSHLFIDEIFPAVAKLFAEKDTDRVTIHVKAGETIFDLSDPSKLHFGVTYNKTKQLSYALEDCAEKIETGEL